MSFDKKAFMQIVSDQLSIARPDHWFKNIFVLPGFAMGLVVVPPTSWTNVGLMLLLGMVAVCLIASANYTINEWLDAETDKHHPVKKFRPSASGRMKAWLVYTQWVVLSVLGMGCAYFLGWGGFWSLGILLVMGILYNVKPIRTKDWPYLDVLSESINNPLRFLLGWFIAAPSSLPPSSVLLAYWMGGAFLMAVKRYSEYRFIGDHARAAAYRTSFAYYSEEKLLLSSFFYALCAAFFLGVFLIKYRIEFILSVPFFALLFVWYLAIGMKADSAAQNPEKLYKERGFVGYVGFLCLIVSVLFFVNIPWLEVLKSSQLLPF